MTQQQDKKLLEGAMTLGVHLGPRHVQAFRTYLEELKRWNRKVNLTSLRKDEDIIEKHFLDSLGGLGLVPPGATKVLDIGSGAGFPGLVFKIVRPEISLSLLEPTGKKAAFLHHVCGRLGLPKTQIIPARLEDLDPEAGRYDCCVSRALASPQKLLAPCRKLLRKQGRKPGKVVLFEGRPGEGGSEPPKGWTREALVYRLPASGVFREIGVYSPA